MSSPVFSSIEVTNTSEGPTPVVHGVVESVSKGATGEKLRPCHAFHVKDCCSFCVSGACGISVACSTRVLFPRGDWSGVGSREWRADEDKFNTNSSNIHDHQMDVWFPLFVSDPNASFVLGNLFAHRQMLEMQQNRLDNAKKV